MNTFERVLGTLGCRFSGDEPVGDPEAGVSADVGSVTRTQIDYQTLYQKTAGELAEARTQEEARRNADQMHIHEASDRAERAEKRAAELELEAMRRRIAASQGLAADAVEFLSGTDEESITQQASKLAAIIPQVTGPVSAGTTTSPASRQEPSVEERISAAQQGGRIHEAISLKRQMVFGG